MSGWEPVIGLEIHVQLDTRTKMFCGCALSFGEPPNTRTCPVCLGLPGTLPVVNAQAVQFGLMMGLALGCEIAPRSIFHRKNYFYPDQAKNYQISQYDIPLCTGGRLGDVRLHRIHLEEDAAKLVHIGESGRIHGSDASIVDYNRGGTPLCEIVTEPDIHSPEQAREWLSLLRVTLRQLGRQRREHGGGVAALRRQRLGPPRRQQRARHQDRAQEHELVPLPRARDQGRDRAPDRAARGRRAGRAGDAALRPGRRPLELAALQGGGARLPLLPRARPRAARADGGDDRRRARRAARAAGRARRALRARLGAGHGRRAAARLRAAVGRLLRDGRGRRRRRRPRRGQLGRAAARADRRRGRPGELERHAAGARRSWSRSSRPSASTPAPAARCSTGSSPRAATRPRSSSARASASMGGGDELAGVVAAAIAANAGAAEKVRAATTRRWARSSAS